MSAEEKDSSLENQSQSNTKREVPSRNRTRPKRLLEEEVEEKKKKKKRKTKKDKSAKVKEVSDKKEKKKKKKIKRSEVLVDKRRSVSDHKLDSQFHERLTEMNKKAREKNKKSGKSVSLPEDPRSRRSLDFADGEVIVGPDLLTALHKHLDYYYVGEKIMMVPEQFRSERAKAQAYRCSEESEVDESQGTVEMSEERHSLGNGSSRHGPRFLGKPVRPSIMPKGGANNPVQKSLGIRPGIGGSGSVAGKSCTATSVQQSSGLAFRAPRPREETTTRQAEISECNDDISFENVFARVPGFIKKHPDRSKKLMYVLRMIFTKEEIGRSSYTGKMSRFPSFLDNFGPHRIGIFNRIAEEMFGIPRTSIATLICKRINYIRNSPKILDKAKSKRKARKERRDEEAESGQDEEESEETTGLPVISEYEVAAIEGIQSGDEDEESSGDEVTSGSASDDEETDESASDGSETNEDSETDEELEKAPKRKTVQKKK